MNFIEAVRKNNLIYIVVKNRGVTGLYVYNGADLGGLNDMQVLQSFVAKNPETQDAINNYLAGDQSATDFAETMGFTPPVPQENWVDGQGGVKGYFGRQNS